MLDGHHTPELAKVRDDKAQSLAWEKQGPSWEGDTQASKCLLAETAKNKTFDGW